MLGILTRAIRPPDVDPNPNDPADVPPATVGPPSATPGDPHGVTVEGAQTWAASPPTIRPSAWSGWPGEWWTPNWSGVSVLSDTAWMCIDLNASVLASMPPYLVDAAPSLAAGWIANPDPDVYTSWEEFAKQLFWDYHLGEAFVLATARYASGFPARFHVVPPWAVNVEMDDGRRRYTIGSVDVTVDILHLRYQGNVSDAHGHGPLEAGRQQLVAIDLMARYVAGFASAGGVPSSILTHPEELTADQATALQSQWIQARLNQLGAPAVLSGGVEWKATQVSPKDAGLTDLRAASESRIAVLLGVPPFLVGLPSGGDSMTYSNVTALFDYHWRAGLRPKAQAVMGGLSGWLLPRGTNVELNRDSYVQPGPLERAQTAEILNRIGALSIDEIRAAERFHVAGAMGMTPPTGAMTPTGSMG